MGPFSLDRRLAAEALGTGLLVATVIGSGLMAETLTRDPAVMLLANALATGAMLVVLIALLAPISGAQLNPVVSLVLFLRGELSRREIGPYVAAQFVGGLVGTALAHAMFGRALFSPAAVVRTGGPQWLAEGVATFGLLVTILVAARVDRKATPWLVGLYIVAAYWFTASTSFANPAVATARAFTASVTGIRLADLPGFIAAQCGGGLAAFALVCWLIPAPRPSPADES